MVVFDAAQIRKDAAANPYNPLIEDEDEEEDDE